MRITIEGKSFAVEAQGTTVTVEGVPFEVTIENEGPLATVLVAGKRFKVQLHKGEEPHVVANVDGKLYQVAVEGALRARASRPQVPRSRTAAPPGAPGAVTAIMPSRVIAVRVKEGDQVQVGDVLLTLEAMKMENDVLAPVSGMVTQLAVSPGTSVNGGDVLVVIG